MRVLAAILTQAGQVTPDVTGILRRNAVEGRGEQQDRPVGIADQLLFDRVHGGAGACRIRSFGEHGPALRDGIDAALGILLRAQRRAIVEERTTVPGAIPAITLAGSR